jgi:phenylalanyl-tRNA synthetase alpha chain
MEKISKEKILEIKKDFDGKIEKAEDERSLNDLKIKFLGRKSDFNQVLKDLKDLDLEEKREIGSLANKIKQEIAEKIQVKQKQFSGGQADSGTIDVTLSYKKPYIGSLNILSQAQREIEKIFTSMGFEIFDGPEVEDEWHNFDALNVPKNHPARDMQDTFWLKQKGKVNGKEIKILPRTQTSNAQIRYMKNNEPPLRIVVPGRAFRNEATDASHEHTFYQFEVLVVDKKINVANFKDIGKKFFTAFFGQDVNVRLRPSYFPFTEPSFEFDISCLVCGGEGCRSCKNTGWLEIGGAGMVHQNVFKAVGYKQNEWQGFAWGFGIERLAMMKYKIDEIRLFKSGDLRFIKQF